MSLYLIGDIQGCDDALQRLLTQLDFSPSRDHLIVLGDLVNRGPDSLAVLHRLRALEGSAQCVLGNHDLHLLAVSHGIRQPHRSDTLAPVLAAPDAQALLHWLTHRPLALCQGPWLMVHAGLLPQWDAAQALALASEVETALQTDPKAFLTHLYGNSPARWTDDLHGPDRWRVIVNALTRLRFCDAQGQMDFDTKSGLASAPPGLMPWFDVPTRRTANTRVAFGHWSALGLLQRPNLLALDTGCVWGGCLSAARLNNQGDVV